MDIIYARGQATAAEVTAALPDPPSYSAVRALLRILEEKGHLRHQEDGPRYVFLPTVSARSRAPLGAAQPRPDVLRRLGGAGRCRADRSGRAVG